MSYDYEGYAKFNREEQELGKMMDYCGSTEESVHGDSELEIAMKDLEKEEETTWNDLHKAMIQLERSQKNLQEAMHNLAKVLGKDKL